ncbi:MAG: bifunctional adenosylcobinamide kinase/adenosylcobinamide-phosphate guanylyltransferase [Oscillospiraceae bacterium]|jgi:adenosylcobinamide kinase/adenosylcobinamide-phosphate guanylyltransferase|nr:bifunctional adenosylcobinamide kinase/adenosylcobinamide-phosphate guanylyltransferase [Oscillospiraceae bacterium]
MRTLVIGGSGSGKSEFAEREITKLHPAAASDKYYIATLMPFGREDEARIARHREQRATRGFTTVEQYTALAELQLPTRGGALLECLGNLAANELFAPEGAGTEHAEAAMLRGVIALESQCDDLIVVTNDVFADGETYEPETENYIAVLAAVNRKLAQRFDRVVEVVCGIPIALKGEIA